MKQPISKPAKHFYSFGPYRLYAADRELFRGPDPVTLPPKAMEALLLLVSHHGHIVDRDRLMKELWPDTFVEETSLGFQIFQLRKTLGDGPDGKGYIETIPKRGYRFTAEVTESWEEARELEGRRPSLEQTPPTQTTGRRRGFRWLVAAAVLLAIGAGLAAYLLFLRPRTVPSKGQVRFVPLTTLPGSEMYPAFSPNGDQVAFAWNGNICVKLLDAGQPLRLTTGSAEDRSPAWSPDSRRIAFSRWFQQDAAIYSIPALGGPERKLADLKCGQGSRHPLFSSLSWSPDGKFLTFGDKESKADRFHIFLLSVETGEKRSLPVASPRFLDQVYPVFSPDGRSLAFIGMNAIDSADLYVVPVSGGESRRLTFDGKGMWGLAWTPDSQEIVFSSYRTGELSLWRVSAFRGTPKPVVGSGIAAEFPTVSPRGDRLVFTRHIIDTNIWRLGLRGAGRNGSATRLIESTYADENPQYSPDEKRIVFDSDRSGTWELWLCDSDGSNPVQLTSLGGPQIGWPSWSPDGRQIAFDSNLSGNWDVYVINADGGVPRPLTTDPSSDAKPTWSMDGRWIYFGSNRTGSFQVWKAPARGGAAVQVTRQGGWTSAVGPDGKFVYYSDQDRSGIWRVPVEGGEETPVLKDYAGAPGFWAPLESGIYFAEPSGGTRLLKFLDFSTGRVKEIFRFEKPLGSSAFAISRDGRWLLYSQIDQIGHDLMLVKNFR